MAESSDRRRRSTRTKCPSLKSELNETFAVKVSVTPLRTPGRRRKARERGREREEEEEEDSQTDIASSEVKSSSRRQRKACSPSHPPDAKVQKVDEEQTPDSEVELTEGAEDSASGRGLPTDGYWCQYRLLCEQLPGREKQIEFLLTVLGKESSFLPQAMYIYGNSGTGKTHTIKSIVKTLQLPCAFVNCQEAYCARLLYETILNQLHGWVPDSAAYYSSFVRCDNLPSFIRELNQLFDLVVEWRERTLLIVMDHADKLREMEPTVLPAMLRLSELSGCRVCVILISQIVYDKIATDLCPYNQLPLHFPDYTKLETLAIMEMDLKSFAERPRPFRQTYVHHIWNVFQNVCRDLSELRHLCTLLFPKYCEPVDSGEIGELEVRRLWRHIQPYFRRVMSRVFLREVSSTQFEQASTSDCSTASGGVVSSLELPLFSKYLLLASYIASYNPAKSDKRFFSKQKQPKIHKAHHPSRKKEKPNCHQLGPKPFPLDRLMAIFYSIVEESVSPSVHIYSQVSTLVTLQLLSQQNSRDSLDSSKYKCLVTFDFIRQVAKSINFDIVQYLQDFN